MIDVPAPTELISIFAAAVPSMALYSKVSPDLVALLYLPATRPQRVLVERRDLFTESGDVSTILLAPPMCLLLATVEGLYSGTASPVVVTAAGVVATAADEGLLLLLVVLAALVVVALVIVLSPQPARTSVAETASRSSSRVFMSDLHIRGILRV